MPQNVSNSVWALATLGFVDEEPLGEGKREENQEKIEQNGERKPPKHNKTPCFLRRQKVFLVFWLVDVFERCVKCF